MLGFGCSPSLNLAFSVPDQMEYKYKSLNITNSTSKVMGQEMESNSTQEFHYTMKEDGLTPDGNHKVNLKYDYIKTAQSAMGTEISYDSKGPKDKNDPTTSSMYEAMLANPFSLIYSSKGDIVGAPGMDKMLDAMFLELPEEAKAAIQTQLNEEVFLQMFQSISNFYPSMPLKIGSTWNQSNHLSIMGMDMDIDIIYTLVSRKDGKANIEIAGVVSTDPEGPGMELMGMTMNYDLTGTQSGIMVVEESTGWQLQMSMDQVMTGAITMDNPSVGPMKIDMDMEMNISLERL